MKSQIIDYLSNIGRKGGSKNTSAQNAARAENGKLGGRPRKSRKPKMPDKSMSGGA